MMKTVYMESTINLMISEGKQEEVNSLLSQEGITVKEVNDQKYVVLEEKEVE